MSDYWTRRRLLREEQMSKIAKPHDYTPIPVSDLPIVHQRWVFGRDSDKGFENRIDDFLAFFSPENELLRLSTFLTQYDLTRESSHSDRRLTYIRGYWDAFAQRISKMDFHSSDVITYYPSGLDLGMTPMENVSDSIRGTEYAQPLRQMLNIARIYFDKCWRNDNLMLNFIEVRKVRSQAELRYHSDLVHYYRKTIPSTNNNAQYYNLRISSGNQQQNEYHWFMLEMAHTFPSWYGNDNTSFCFEISIRFGYHRPTPLNLLPYMPACVCEAHEKRLDKLLSEIHVEDFHKNVLKYQYNLDTHGDCLACKLPESSHFKQLLTDENYFLKCLQTRKRRPLSADATSSNMLRPDWLQEIFDKKSHKRRARCNVARPRCADVDKITEKNCKLKRAQARRLKEEIMRQCGLMDVKINQGQLDQIGHMVTQITSSLRGFTSTIDAPLNQMATGHNLLGQAGVNLSDSANTLTSALKQYLPQIIALAILSVVTGTLLKAGWKTTAVVATLTGLLAIFAPQLAEMSLIKDVLEKVSKWWGVKTAPLGYHMCGLEDVSKYMCSTSMPFVGTVFAGFLAVLFIKKLPDDRDWMKLYKKLDAVPKAAKGIETMTDYFSKALDWVKKQYIKICHPDMSERLITTSEAVQKFMDKINKAMHPDYFRAIAKDEEKVKECSTLFNDYTNLIRTENALPRAIMEKLRELRYPMNEILKEVYKSNALGNAYRIRPVCVSLHGPSSIGKTVLTYPIAIDILRAFDYVTPQMVREDPDCYTKFVYSRNPTQEYWDGYDGNKHIVFYDDAFQARDSVGNPNLELTELIHLVNNFPINLHMADINAKANTQFVGKGVILTSNDENMKFESIVCNDAVYNRLDLPYRVAIKSEYCLKDRHGRDVQKLDVAKARENGQIFNLDVYKFKRIVFTKDGHHTIGEWIDYNQLRSIIYAECADRKANFRGANQFLRNYAATPRPDVAVETNPAPQYTITMADAGRQYIAQFHQTGLESHTTQDLNNEPRVCDLAYSAPCGLDKVLSSPGTVQSQDHEGYALAGELGYHPAMEMSLSRYNMFAKIGDGLSWVFTPFSKLTDYLFPLHLEPSHHEGGGSIYKPYRQFRPARFISEVYESGLEEVESTEPVFHECSDDIEKFTLETQTIVRFNAFKAGRHALDKLQGMVQSWKDTIMQFFQNHPVLALITAAVSCIGLVGMFWLLFRKNKKEVCATEMTVSVPESYAVKFEQKSVSAARTDKTARQFKLRASASKPIKAARQFRLKGKPYMDWTVDQQDLLGLAPSNFLFKQTWYYTDDDGKKHEAWFEGFEYDENHQIVAMTFETDDHSVTMDVYCETGTQAGNELSRKALASTYWLYHGDHAYGTVIGLKGNLILMPNHYRTMFEKSGLKDEDVLTIRNETNVDGVQFFYKQVKTAVQIENEFGPKDICVFNAGKNMPSFKNIVGNFINQRDLDKVSGSNCVFNYRPRISPERFLDIHRQCEGVVRCEDIPYITKEGKEVVFRQNYVLSTFAAEDGDCGNILICDNKMIPNKYCGILTGGSKSETAFAGLTQEDLLKACQRFAPDAQIAWTPDETVEEGFFEKGKLHDVQNFIPIGTSQPVQTPTKSKLEKTPMYEKVYPSKKKPAKLRPFVGSDGDVIDPLTRSMRKVGLPSVVVDEQALEMAAADVLHLLMTARHPGINPEDYLHELSDRETVMGRSGDEFIGSLTRTTSPGYPHVFKAPRHMPGKSYWFGNDDDFKMDEEPAKEMLGLTALKIQRAKQGQRTMSIYTDTLKDEKRPNEKVDRGDTRLFSAAPLEVVLAVRKYYLGALAYIMHNHVENGIAVGINPHSYKWDRLAHHLQSKGQKIVAGDFSNYDGSLNATILRKCNWIFNEMYDDGPENRLIRDVLFEDVVSSHHICGDKVYQWNKSLPSGVPLTAVLNSIYNLVSMRMVWRMETGRTMMEFNKHVWMIAYGDDNVINIADCVASEFNQTVMARGYERIGMKYTDESKTGVSDQFRTLDQVSFLKRYFRYSNDLGRYVAPLEVDSITEMFNWYHKTGTPLKSLADNVGVMMLEWSKYDRQTWEREYKKIMKALPPEAKRHLNIGHSYVEYLEYWRTGKLDDLQLAYFF